MVGTAVSEGTNIPSTPEAVTIFLENILFTPGKATNVGGMATSGLEMAQNIQRYFWSRKEVDSKLQEIMVNIHNTVYETVKMQGEPDNYVLGANIASCMKVANPMIAQGHIACTSSITEELYKIYLKQKLKILMKGRSRSDTN